MQTNHAFTCPALFLFAFLNTPAGSAAVLDALPLPDTAPSATTTTTLPLPATIDLGYLRVEAESCIALGPAQRSIAELAAFSHALTTRQAATLNFSWRQIQHYRAEHGSAHELCYYAVP